MKFSHIFHYFHSANQLTCKVKSVKNWFNYKRKLALKIKPDSEKQDLLNYIQIQQSKEAEKSEKSMKSPIISHSIEKNKDFSKMNDFEKKLEILKNFEKIQDFYKIHNNFANLHNFDKVQFLEKLQIIENLKNFEKTPILEKMQKFDKMEKMEKIENLEKVHNFAKILENLQNLANSQNFSKSTLSITQQNFLKPLIFSNSSEFFKNLQNEENNTNLENEYFPKSWNLQFNPNSQDVLANMLKKQMEAFANYMKMVSYSKYMSSFLMMNKMKEKQEKFIKKEEFENI